MHVVLNNLEFPAAKVLQLFELCKFLTNKDVLGGQLTCEKYHNELFSYDSLRIVATPLLLLRH